MRENKKIKVLLLLPEVSARGGIEVFSKMFLSSLSKSKEVLVLAILMNNKKLPEAKTEHCSLKVRLCGSKNKIFQKLKFLFWFFWELFFFKPDCIIANHINLARPCFFLWPFLKINYAVIVYGGEVWRLSFFQKKILKKAKIISGLSRFTISKIKEQIELANEKILLCLPAVQKDRFVIKEKNKKLVKALGLESKKIILTVTRFSRAEQYKGYDKVVEVLPEVIKEFPNLKYLLVGEGDDIGRVKQLVKTLGLQDHVVFCGFVPAKNLPDYYNLCDVFVMPSKGEGFGLVFLEALACGKPVIAGNKDGSRETLLNGELGVLVDPDDLDEIAGAIIRVLKKEAPQRLLNGQYLRKRALEVYGPGKFEEKVKNLISLITDY